MTPDSCGRDLNGCWRRTGGLRAVVAAALLLGASCCPTICFAQGDSELSIDGGSPERPDEQPEMSRNAWRQRVEEARQRARDVARDHIEHPEVYAPVHEDPELIASERVLNDDSLQQGDIVTTKKGMFIFRGRPDQPRLQEDFVPLPPNAAR